MQDFPEAAAGPQADQLPSLSRADLEGRIGASELERWWGLRRREDGTLVALENDGNLTAQLAGMKRWLRAVYTRLEKSGGKNPLTGETLAVKREQLDDIALGYVVRQLVFDAPPEMADMAKDLKSENALYNVQGKESLNKDQIRLRIIAARLPESEAVLKNNLLAVEKALGHSGRFPEDNEVKFLIDLAAAAFYLETGISAARQAAALEDNEQDRKIYLTLAANAINNNMANCLRFVGEIATNLLGDLKDLSVNGRPVSVDVLDQDRYAASKDIAKRSPSSYEPPKAEAGPQPGDRARLAPCVR